MFIMILVRLMSKYILRPCAKTFEFKYLHRDQSKSMQVGIGK